MLLFGGQQGQNRECGRYSERAMHDVVGEGAEAGGPCAEGGERGARVVEHFFGQMTGVGQTEQADVGRFVLFRNAAGTQNARCTM